VVTHGLTGFQALLGYTMAYSEDEEHLLPLALFISEDSFPRSHEAGFLSYIISWKRVTVIPKIITGPEERETSLMGSGRLRSSL